MPMQILLYLINGISLYNKVMDCSKVIVIANNTISGMVMKEVIISTSQIICVSCRYL